ncbi:MAG: transglycosylase domain-containing protein [Faecousia sp.]
MAKKKLFWERKKEYYRFPLWMRMVKGVFTVGFTAVKLALGAVLIALSVVLITGVVFACYLGDYLQEDVIPNADYTLENIDLDQTSFIYYVDQNNKVVELQQIYTSIDRVWVPYDEIPQDLVHAAVAIEDKRFFQHQGVDWVTTVKACANMFLGSRSTFGGSTITQQLIKNLTDEDDVTVRRKVQEIFRALRFEEHYDKEVVMEWYLNTIYLGENCYGVQTAARTYFGKDVKDLTAAECASLISITNNPSLYDPYISMERNRDRQVVVLEQMHEQGYLDDRQYQEALEQKMVFTSVSADAELYTCENCGLTSIRDSFEYNDTDQTYQCPTCSAYVDIPEEEVDYYSYFEDTVIRDVCADMMEKYGYDEKVCMQMIKTGGFHIYTTIDMEVQKLVDQVYQNMDNIPTVDSMQQPQSAIVVMDNATGDIVAMAGGVGKKESFLGWNRATEPLQPGSSIKPVSVYSPAMELGVINPATLIFDGPLYDQYPQNYDRVYSGNTIVQDGVSQSMNTVACKVVDSIGVEYSFDFAKNKFGLSTLIEDEVINGDNKTDIALAPLAMGAPTFGVTVRDLTTAYGTFTNNGVWREARTYLKVLDSEGNVVLDNTQETRQILSKKTVDYMNSMLCYAVSNGTSYYARIPGMTVAGKTGTTSGDRDRWFAGYTPYYTAVVWFGFDQPESIYLTGNYVNPAARLWKAVMEPLHENLEDRDLFDYSAMRTVEICTESGLRATDACRADVRDASCVMSVRLYPEDIPTKDCDVHVMMEYCEAGKALANEYCAKITGNTVIQKGLVKLTEEMVKLYEEAQIDTTSFAFKEDGETCKVHTKEMYDKQEKPGIGEIIGGLLRP